MNITDSIETFSSMRLKDSLIIIMYRYASIILIPRSPEVFQKLNRGLFKVLVPMHLKDLELRIKRGFWPHAFEKGSRVSFRSRCACLILPEPVNNVAKAMVGKMTGVQVVQGTGQPGTPLSVKVRGVGTITAGTEPLYVIDNVPTSANNLNTLNTYDIESIEVLKDASSSAIY